MKRMEEINDSLRQATPMLPPPSDANQSALGGTPSKPQSMIGKSIHDTKSEISMPFSSVSRHSQFTMLTHATKKAPTLPKEGHLREKAEERHWQN